MADGGADGRWLTYDEIAAVRGTQRVGAIRWVQRHKWRRQPGNDGLVRVLVPPDALTPTAPPRRSAPTVTPDSAATAFTAALATILEAHSAEVAVLREQLAGERDRALDLRRDLEAAHAAAREAQDVAEDLRRAEAVRKARGLVARLRAAWWGE